MEFDKIQDLDVEKLRFLLLEEIANYKWMCINKYSVFSLKFKSEINCILDNSFIYNNLRYLFYKQITPTCREYWN